MYMSATTDGVADRVVVAVRLRPWINPQIGAVAADRARAVVRIREATAEVVDPRSGTVRGRFTYDECFDSFSPSDESYADQERVFDALGPPLVRSAHACMQTATAS